MYDFGIYTYCVSLIHPTLRLCVLCSKMCVSQIHAFPPVWIIMWTVVVRVPFVRVPQHWGCSPQGLDRWQISHKVMPVLHFMPLNITAVVSSPTIDLFGNHVYRGGKMMVVRFQRFVPSCLALVFDFVPEVWVRMRMFESIESMCQSMLRMGTILVFSNAQF